MSHEIRWTRRALARLDEIGEYIARDNPAAAGRQVALIVQAIMQLGRQPALGRLGRIPGTRELIVVRTSYIAVYRVHREDIEVLTVQHGARQWPDRL